MAFTLTQYVWISVMIMCVPAAYLNTYEENTSLELQNIRGAQSRIVALLEHSSRVKLLQ